MTYRSSPRSFVAVPIILAAVLLTPMPARAQGTQVVTIGPVLSEQVEFNFCTGETVLVSANTKAYLYFLFDSSGTIHVTDRILVHGTGQVVDEVTHLPTSATP